jgi:hypothetical protein
MKLCKDCKHIVEVGTYLTFCGHPDTPREPVYGNLYETCALMRSGNCLTKAACGPDGAWFEEAPPKPEPPPEPQPTPEPQPGSIQCIEPPKAAGFWETLICNILG